MIIREFEDADAPAISRIIRECFETLEMGRHTEKGVALQVASNDPERLAANAKKLAYYVAEMDGRPAGICGLDQSKIRTFFVDPQLHHRGIGGALLSSVLAEARSRGITRLITWSTFYAQPFYSKAGFRAVREVRLPEGAEDIVLMEMETHLR